MVKTVSLIMVGTGDIARYVAGFSRIIPGMRVVAVVNPDIAQAEYFSRINHTGPAYATLEDALSDFSEAAVYLAVPHHLHFPYLREILSAGRPVLTEKPITRIFSEGAQIASEAQKAGIPVAVNYQSRYDPAFDRVRRQVDARRFGRPLFARCFVPWSRDSTYFTRSAWHSLQTEAGGGTLLTQGSHTLDLALRLLGGVRSGEIAPIRVSAIRRSYRFPDIEVEDTAAATIEMENGTFAQIISTMASPRESAMRFDLVCEDATVSWRGGVGPFRTTLRTRPGFRPQNIRDSPAGLPFGFHPLHRSLVGFRNLVAEGIPHRCTAVDSLPVLLAIELAYRATENSSTAEATANEIALLHSLATET